jgi:microcystin-dependent protein
MGTPYLGEIRIFSFNFTPKGWAMCNGQLLAINQNQALFSLLGTTYGGNGINNFSLPNLQGRTPVYVGNGLLLGQTGGEQSHTLTINEIPLHTHPVTASSAAADNSVTQGNVWAKTESAYATAATGTMDPTAVPMAGGGQPHNNMQPYLVLSFCIALQGIFPSRN